jgi:hypothetical protein
MSERERWIVYPLLLLTLGLALRDKFGIAKEVKAHRIVCEELVVMNGDDKPQIVLESTNAGGVVRAINADRSAQLVLGHEENASSLFYETATDSGMLQRVLVGDLRRFSPQHAGKWPLLDPRLKHAAPPAVDPAAKPAD